MVERNQKLLNLLINSKKMRGFLGFWTKFKNLFFGNCKYSSFYDLMRDLIVLDRSKRISLRTFIY